MATEVIIQLLCSTSRTEGSASAEFIYQGEEDMHARQPSLTFEKWIYAGDARRG